jgi:parallel beta-helix repeat protein
MKALNPVHRFTLTVMLSMLALVGTVMSPYAATAATYYVAKTGNDSNPGTQAQPLQTINRGIGTLKAGDTLYIRGGNYAEDISSAAQTIPAGTSWTNPITIAAYLGESVTIRSISLMQSSIKYLVFDGLIIDRQYTVGQNAVYFTGGANHIRLKNCEITHGGDSGVLMPYSGGSNYNEFINCNIHDNGILPYTPPQAAYGFYMATDHNLIDGCLIHDNGGYGIHAYSGVDGTVHDNVFRNNKIYNNGLQTPHGTAGIILSSGNNNLAYNNLIYNNNTGVQIAYTNPTNIKVYNNTIYGNSGIGIYIIDGQNAEIKNNIVYQNASGNISDVDGATGTVLSNNLTTDPKFVNPSTFNFSLQAGSSAMDNGVTISIVTSDFAGVSRPQGANSDIGAYEFVQQNPVLLSSPKNFRIVSK